MKIKTLNEDHQEIIDQFYKDIESFIYDVTEGERFGSFQSFTPVKDAAINLHNELADELIDLGIPNYEWVFMLPNNLLFAALGFATGLKNEKNFEFIQNKSERLCDVYTNTIAELDMMNETICKLT